MSFWQNLPKPILALAPMEEVTDTIFRQVILKCGRPSVMFTEFTSTEGICSVGQPKVIHRLKYTEIERPLVAQIWGITPENYFASSKLIKELGFDGIDINMGCPVKKIIKKGACSALIKNPNLAKEIIQATQEGAGNLPVSVKTRIGFNQIQTEEWLGFLLGCNLEVLTVHGRTVKEESKVPCHWEEIGKVAELKNQLSPKTLILGNGDVNSLQEAKDKIQEYKLDGIMIGRGVFKNPWLFNEAKPIDTITISDRIEMLIYHLDLFQATWQEEKHYSPLKRFFKIYIQNFPEASELRQKLMDTHNAVEAVELLNTYQQSLSQS